MVPKYARAWGDVQPLSRIYGQYDKTIPLNRIFLQKIESKPEGRLVVRQACKPCIDDNANCNRGTPKCQYCKKWNGQCSYDDNADCVDLPGMDPNGGTVGETRAQHREKKPPPAVTAYDTEVSFPLHIGGRKRKNDKKASELKSTGVIEKKRKLSGSEITKKGKVTWYRVKTVPEENVAKQIEPSNLPRIWSETYEELLGAVPALASMNNGFSDDGSLAPMILLDKSSWPSGAWDGSEKIELSTTRMFSLSDTHSSPPVLNAEPKHMGAPMTPSVAHNGIPEDLPDDISKLEKAHYDGMPVAIIIHRDWPRFPLKMDPKCKYIVLGFFHIEEIQRYFKPLPQITKFGISRRRGEVKWTFTFQWVPGGDPEDRAAIGSDTDSSMDIDKPSASPQAWWLPPSPHGKLNAQSSNPKIIKWNDQNWDFSGSPRSRHRFSPIMLDLNILAKHIARDGQNTSCATRSWYCVKCGRVNRTHWMTRYPCSCCPNEIFDAEIENLEDLGTLHYPPEVIHASAVRDRLRPTPLWIPIVHLPPNVEVRMREWKNGLRWFTYSYRYPPTIPPMNYDKVHGQTYDQPGSLSRLLYEGDLRIAREGKRKADSEADLSAGAVDVNVNSLIIDYLFLGNRVKLENNADKLFTDIQKSVPMTFESTLSKPTAGIFKFSISPVVAANVNEGYATWSTAHPCTRKAREMMIAGARSCGKQHISEESITHLSFIAWLGESPVKREIKVKAKQHPVLLMSLGADLEVTFANPGETHRQKKKPKFKAQKVQPNASVDAISEQDIQNQISQAGIGDDIWGEKQTRPEPPSEVSRIMLTHGSLLILSGSDVDLTVIRSEFAILLRGYQEP